ncbi:hypothetical protein JDV02_010744 [Purpureocillium takamizusanense]|uniref:Aminoglycoside phosphotransferase domain-containing protein n=1 Tax=Purpureocillium takamizusanense TaxID=2060973 RepID=A0A9Q8QSL6_9HYPO|nr:uncharacterized protein JDV02_010744 [Purpureocillium takamizusanense]UNI25035.1 hypothetical protein JDV02_010744 [Purpureocillium takamizusanense]
MPTTLNLAGQGPVTLDWALAEERDVIDWASYRPAADRLIQDLWSQKDTIEALIRYHMCLTKRDDCVVLPPQHWIQGAFNMCIFAEITYGGSAKSGNTRRVVFRCPMPHKLAEARSPGTIDEKMGCEIGAYAWVEDHCPEIPSPHLFGFGLTNGRHFTHSKHMPLLPRTLRHCWRFIHWVFGLPLLSHYVQNHPSGNLTSAYMLLEYLGPDTGRMLSDTFGAQWRDVERRKRLFRGMSRIMLSLAKIPQPRIGSFCFNDDGTITLTNRPLSFDEEWNVTGLIDLEWICALPREMHCVPYWLTGCAIDGLIDEHSDEFDKVREEFMLIFGQEERLMRARARDFCLTKVMRETWDSRGVWFWYCISSVNAMCFLLEANILPAGSLGPEAEGVISKFWCRDSRAVVKAKLEDRKAYDEELRKLFR